MSKNLHCLVLSLQNSLPNPPPMYYFCAVREWFNLCNKAFTRLWKVINEGSYYNINLRNAIKIYLYIYSHIKVNIETLITSVLLF